MSLVVKSMTIRIETSLATTPENGHRLAMYDSVGFVKSLSVELETQNSRGGRGGVKGALFGVYLDP